jgi:hypothetical protein
VYMSRPAPPTGTGVDQALPGQDGPEALSALVVALLRDGCSATRARQHPDERLAPTGWGYWGLGNGNSTVGEQKQIARSWFPGDHDLRKPLCVCVGKHRQVKRGLITPGPETTTVWPPMPW